jgi:hypothetical protein
MVYISKRWVIIILTGVGLNPCTIFEKTDFEENEKVGENEKDLE